MRSNFRSLESAYRHLGEAEEAEETPKRPVTADEARKAGKAIGYDFDKYDLEQLRRGMEVEFEHGKVDQETNVTDDDTEVTAKIAWAHIKEIPDYYDRLDKMESEARKGK